MAINDLGKVDGYDELIGLEMSNSAPNASVKTLLRPLATKSQRRFGTDP
ncbi:hypothetical protein [Rubripirellula lacrimiformis]|nr:hypothetical protein [Rubripirellula lacrimiformis]